MAVQVKEREHQDVETEQLMSGCEAIAEAIRLADVDVMAAYPIRPYDGVMQAAAKLIANGKMEVEYIVADGEHSQLEIVKHACAVGSRVFVGSSGVGWFYAFEAIAVTGGLRLPVVAICGNRALGDRLLHPDNPITIAPQVDQDWLMEIRMQNDQAMRKAHDVIGEAHADFKKLFGRGGDSPFLDEYMTDDAEYVFFGQGTLALPMKVAIRRLRKEGHKVGLVRLKWFRPFPTQEIVKSLSRFKAVGIIDRDYSFGSPHYGGVLYNEVRSALYSQEKRPTIVGFIAGLGGREIEQPMATEIFEKTKAAASDIKSGDICHWIGVRS